MYKPLDAWTSAEAHTTAAEPGPSEQPHTEMYCLYKGFLLADTRKRCRVCVGITALTHKAHWVDHHYLTYTTSPTAFSVRNLHRYSKLSVHWGIIHRSAKTHLLQQHSHKSRVTPLLCLCMQFSRCVTCVGLIRGVVVSVLMTSARTSVVNTGRRVTHIITVGLRCRTFLLRATFKMTTSKWSADNKNA